MTAPLLTVPAGALAKALLPTLPRRKSRTHRPASVILAYERLTQTLIVAEAKHSRFLTTIRLDAGAHHWPQEVTVDGVLLARTVETFLPDVAVTLAYDDTALIVRCGGSCVRLNRSKRAEN